VSLRIDYDVCVRACLTKSKERTTGEGKPVPFVPEYETTKNNRGTLKITDMCDG